MKLPMRDVLNTDTGFSEDTLRKLDLAFKSLVDLFCEASGWQDADIIGLFHISHITGRQHTQRSAAYGSVEARRQVAEGLVKILPVTTGTYPVIVDTETKKGRPLMPFEELAYIDVEDLDKLLDEAETLDNVSTSVVH